MSEYQSGHDANLRDSKASEGHHSALQQVKDQYARHDSPHVTPSSSKSPLSKEFGDISKPSREVRSSSPIISNISTPRSKPRKDRSYWSASHPDDQKGHRHHHHHHHSNHHRSNIAATLPSYSHYSDALPGAGRHSLSRDNRSIQDLSVLNTLVDERTGYYEEKRATEEFLQSIGKRKKIGASLRAYYERMNTILDGWREVDEILDSHFPEEVMRRFGTVEEVEETKRRGRKRLPWLENSDEGEDSGYQEESELDSEDEGGVHLKRNESFTARAASALSGFWFGTPTSHKSNKIKANDEESALINNSSRNIHEYSPSLRKSRPNYGTTNSFRASGQGLATIEDTETSNAKDGRRSDPPAAGDVLIEEDGDVKAVAVGNDPNALKEKAKLSLKAARDKRKSAILPANSDTDDEMTTEDDGSEAVDAGSLDRKLANEREERKARSKRRDVVIPGTGGQVTRINGRSTSTGNESSENRAKQKQKNTPGGLSERERRKLLEHVPGRAEKEDERERGARFAININLAVNVLLLAGKAFAVFSSNSVSLLASLVDSALDLLSTVIIFGTSRAIAYRSWHTYFKYPVGKKRFEPLGVVIFSVLMIASFVQVLVESAERLWKVMHLGINEPNELAQLPLVGVAFMVLTIIIKAFMWVIYRKSPSSGVRAVAQDAENDVVFNVASLIFPVIGGRLGWPALDPIGGICLSIYIIWEWLETLTETVSKLSGAAASPDSVTRALYLVTRFRSVESVSAFELYHAGDDLIAEADVVLPLGLALKEAHDLGEIITYCLESIGQ